MTDAQAMAAVKSTIERRVNAYGVTEPIIQMQGSNRMLVEFPASRILIRQSASSGRLLYLSLR